MSTLPAAEARTAVKNSGYGRFGGTAGLASFTEQRWITIQHSGPTYPF